MFWMYEGCFRICTRMCVPVVTARVPLHNSFCFYSFRLCWVYKRSTLMNNEAITTTADHKAPPARSTLLDRVWAFPPTAASSCWRNTGFSLFALLKASAENFCLSAFKTAMSNVRLRLQTSFTVKATCTLHLGWWFNFNFNFFLMCFYLSPIFIRYWC